MSKDKNRPFPIQGNGSAPGGWIPWWLAEIVYAGYSARYGTEQSLERMAERGGFCFGEVGMFLTMNDCKRGTYLYRKVSESLTEAWNKAGSDLT